VSQVRHGVELARPVGRDRRRMLALAIKRGIDIAGAIAGLVVVAPIVVGLRLVAALNGSGPVLFRQEREGFDGRRFVIFKLRSMTPGDDPQVTRLGRLLRSMSLDELPQMWNVLIGEMSLVGPRPHVVDMQVNGVRYRDLVPRYDARHLMRPGLTGLAQVSGWRGPVADDAHAAARIACDLRYVREFSLWLDLSILLRTLRPSVLFTRDP
jgi:lipopolysaccharide/colanic/teichoic acid biosynthesis glycosyltransferase